MLCGNTGYEDEVFTSLKKAEKLLVYKKADMDASFHYKDSRRIMPIIVTSYEGYALCQNALFCGQQAGNSVMFYICTLYKC